MSTTTTRNTPPKIPMEALITHSKEVNKEYRGQSTGSDGYTRFNRFCPKLIGTSGVMQMAEELGAFWYLDIVASYLPKVIKAFRDDDARSFFVCRIHKLEGNKAIFTIDEGHEDGEYLVTQEIPYTDSQWNLKTYLQTDGEHWILMMPQEY